MSPRLKSTSLSRKSSSAHNCWVGVPTFLFSGQRGMIQSLDNLMQHQKSG